MASSGTGATRVRSQKKIEIIWLRVTRERLHEVQGRRFKSSRSESPKMIRGQMPMVTPVVTFKN